LRPVIIGLALAALVIGGAMSWFASADPDGLEWSMAKVSGKEELEAPEGIHGTLDALQKRIAFLPDYNFKSADEPKAEPESKELAAPEPWPNVAAGTSLSGIIGGFMTLCLAGLLGFAIRKRHAKA